MVKSVFNYTHHIFTPIYDDIPKPPELPEFKPEKSYWIGRLAKGITDVEGTENWTRIGDVPKEDDKPDWRGVIRKNVIELPMPGKYDFGQPQDPRYYFFDTPDYADPFKKLWWANKFFLKTGGVLFGLLGIMESTKFTWENNMQLLSRTLKPVYVGGMIGTLAVLTISNLRGQKDDYLNYALAGFIAGSYLGRRDHARWFRYNLVWPPLAIGAKYGNEHNMVLWPNDSPGRGRNLSLSANSTEHGLYSGDLRTFEYHKDPGRDTRKIAM